MYWQRRLAGMEPFESEGLGPVEQVKPAYEPKPEPKPEPKKERKREEY